MMDDVFDEPFEEGLGGEDEQTEPKVSVAGNSKQNQGGGRMKVRRKRNISGMLERLERLQRALKESRKMYLAEQGMVVLRWYQEYKEGKVGVRELEERLKEVADLYGKSLDEPLE
jgi:hypothetical protein